MQRRITSAINMDLINWIVRIPGSIRRRTTLKVSYLSDSSSFHRSALAERMRVDRNGSCLSILLLQLPEDRSTHRDYQFLAGVLEGRLRITDAAGLLADGRIGVLLPDTPPAGAWKVASDICEVYPVGHERPDCEVLAYPDQHFRGNEQSKRHAKEPVAAPSGTGANGNVESLFACAVPFWKRSLDVTGATIGLIVATPLILLAGAAIKFSSRGPVFYSQEREGLGGRRFRIWKLRTMRMNADQLKDQLRPYSEQDGPAFKMMRDPRITHVGRILRRFSLDELPQLWNVLRGDMSLVGPRPLPVDESLGCLAWQRRRLQVTPGLTCIWQIKGRNVVPFEEWIRMDLEYARRRSPWLDLQLLVRTPPALILAKGPR
jgi:lipopolysaccharide/colanic/teichoic acid biosynthesis glycosyltransferase